MKVLKSVKNIFKNHTILFVIVAAVALLYFIDNYSKNKGLEGAASTNISAKAFSDQGGAFPMDPPVLYLQTSSVFQQ